MPFNLENPKQYNPKRDKDEVVFFNRIGKKLEQEYEGLIIEQDKECFILTFNDKKVFVQKFKNIEMADDSKVAIEDHLRQVIEGNGLIKKSDFEQHLEQAA